MSKSMFPPFFLPPIGSDITTPVEIQPVLCQINVCEYHMLEYMCVIVPQRTSSQIFRSIFQGIR